MRSKLLRAFDLSEAKGESPDRIERNPLGLRQRIENMANQQDPDQYSQPDNQPDAVQRHKQLGNPKRFFSNKPGADCLSFTQVE